MVEVCVPDMLCDCDWDDKGLTCCWRIGCNKDVGNCVWICYLKIEIIKIMIKL